jgi:fusaric acid resistance family protein
MIGTVVGAVAIVVLTAIFPQQRAFLVCLALWGAACALVASLVANFTSYAAALAGYTAAIIAADQLGPTGGGPHRPESSLPEPTSGALRAGSPRCSRRSRATSRVSSPAHSRGAGRSRRTPAIRAS